MSVETLSPLVCTTSLRVRYAETDVMGVVYYANYLVWFEIGRTDWLRQTGQSYRDMEAEGTQLPVIEAACAYRRPARYDDVVEIRTRATRLTPVRVRFDYEVVGPGGDLLAEGRTIHAAITPDGKPRRLPASVAALFGAGLQ